MRTRLAVAGLVVLVALALAGCAARYGLVEALQEHACPEGIARMDVQIAFEDGTTARLACASPRISGLQGG